MAVNNWALSAGRPLLKRASSFLSHSNYTPGGLIHTAHTHIQSLAYRRTMLGLCVERAVAAVANNRALCVVCDVHFIFEVDVILHTNFVHVATLSGALIEGEEIRRPASLSRRSDF